MKTPSQARRFGWVLALLASGLLLLPTVVKADEFSDDRADLDRQHRETMDGIEKRIRDLEKLEDKTLKDKINSLREMKRGAFCSKCGRTATEIKNDGDGEFGEHVRQARGVVVPANALQLEDKEIEWDRKLEQIRKDLAAAKAERGKEDARHRKSLAELDDRRRAEAARVLKEALLKQQMQVAAQREEAQRQWRAMEEQRKADARAAQARRERELQEHQRRLEAQQQAWAYQQAQIQKMADLITQRDDKVKQMEADLAREQAKERDNEAAQERLESRYRDQVSDLKAKLQQQLQLAMNQPRETVRIIERTQPIEPPPPSSQPFPTIRVTDTGGQMSGWKPLSDGNGGTLGEIFFSLWEANKTEKNGSKEMRWFFLSRRPKTVALSAEADVTPTRTSQTSQRTTRSYVLSPNAPVQGGSATAAIVNLRGVKVSDQTVPTLNLDGLFGK